MSVAQEAAALSANAAACPFKLHIKTTDLHYLGTDIACKKPVLHDLSPIFTHCTITSACKGDFKFMKRGVDVRCEGYYKNLLARSK